MYSCSDIRTGNKGDRLVFGSLIDGDNPIFNNMALRIGCSPAAKDVAGTPWDIYHSDISNAQQLAKVEPCVDIERYYFLSSTLEGV